jgi:uracil-DNA glycosylase family 4
MTKSPVINEGKLPNNLNALEKQIVSCRRCPRLVEWRERMGREKRRAYREETYWARPVPGFGDDRARVLAVGLAPGAHGSNRTGRMFTGDASGGFLYPALFRAGFADRPEALARDDGLGLDGLFITAVCRCAPPDNKPTPAEIANCLPYLAEEIRLLPELRVLAALGKVAYDTLGWMLKKDGIDPGGPTPGKLHPALRWKEKIPPFGHGAEWKFESAAGRSYWLIASYHPSRQNTQTGRLTVLMFDRVWRKVRELAFESTKAHEEKSEGREEKI